MPLIADQYICFWVDVDGEEASSSFSSPSDGLAIGQAATMAAISTAKMTHFFKLQELGPVPTHDADTGSNVKAKTFFIYKTVTKKIIRLSVPSFNLSFLEVDGVKTNVDRISGVGRLQTRAGNVATKFVKGLFSKWK